MRSIIGPRILLTGLCCAVVAASGCSGEAPTLEKSGESAEQEHVGADKVRPDKPAAPKPSVEDDGAAAPVDGDALAEAEAENSYRSGAEPGAAAPSDSEMAEGFSGAAEESSDTGAAGGQPRMRSRGLSPAEPSRPRAGATRESNEVAAMPPPAAAPSSSTTTAQPAASADWDIVPVFYGTDRRRADNSERLDYDGNRGRKLELGHALVSVPKSHQVPNIERPWAIKIPYFNVTIYEEAQDPKRHFVIQKITALSRSDFLAVVRERLTKSKTFEDQAFVFVHGYNTSFDIGVYRTAQIAYDLKFDGAPFLYSWPSGGGVASYTYDRESSGQSIPYMRDFMKLVINETGAKAVSVIAHSMGNQPILQVLRDLKRSTPDDVVISQVILAAPDVDRDNFENIAKEILGLAKGVTLYVAANDQALQFSRRFHGGVPRAGDVPLQGPIIIDGIDTIDITAASTDSLGINHSGYAENNALLNDIGRLIATGAPPSARIPPQFQRIEQGQRHYWKYPQPN